MPGEEGHLETDAENARTTEAEIGMEKPQAKESQGLMATLERGRGKEGCSPPGWTR